MKVKCRISTGRRKCELRKVIEIDDRELEGLTEEEKIDVIEKYFNRWLLNAVEVEWEIEDYR